MTIILISVLAVVLIIGIVSASQKKEDSFVSSAPRQEPKEVVPAPEPEPEIEIEWRKTIRMAGTNKNGLTRADAKLFRGQAVAEPDNIYDPNAVAIIRSDKKKLGYIPKARAEKIAKKLAKFGGQANCVGSIEEEEEYGTGKKFLVGYVQILWPTE